MDPRQFAVEDRIDELRRTRAEVRSRPRPSRRRRAQPTGMRRRLGRWLMRVGAALARPTVAAPGPSRSM